MTSQHHVALSLKAVVETCRHHDYNTVMSERYHCGFCRHHRGTLGKECRVCKVNGRLNQTFCMRMPEVTVDPDVPPKEFDDAYLAAFEETFLEEATPVMKPLSEAQLLLHIAPPTVPMVSVTPQKEVEMGNCLQCGGCGPVTKGCIHYGPNGGNGGQFSILPRTVRVGGLTLPRILHPVLVSALCGQVNANAQDTRYHPYRIRNDTRDFRLVPIDELFVEKVRATWLDAARYIDGSKTLTRDKKEWNRVYNHVMTFFTTLVNHSLEAVDYSTWYTIKAIALEHKVIPYATENLVAPAAGSAAPLGVPEDAPEDESAPTAAPEDSASGCYGRSAPLPPKVRNAKRIRGL